MQSSRRHWLALAAAGLLRADAPKRNMIVRSQRPSSWETPMDGLADWITPVDRFFVRSHHDTPRVEAAAWKLTLGGLVEKPLSLTLAAIERLPAVESVAVLECAGNGRGLFEPALIGLQWEYGAVGNGRWKGVRLRDLLLRAGVKPGTKEVVFNGADQPVGTMPKFVRSLPLERALHPGTLLAYQLNGLPLPAEHGFPLRLVVPGWAGDAWMKWVTGIELIDREYDGFFMTTAYRHPGRLVPPGAAVDPKDMKPVTSLVVKSIITSPVEGASLPAGDFEIRGAAWSGGAEITRVEVSLDGGRTWRLARLGTERAPYAWRRFSAPIANPRPGYYHLCARAFDSAGASQPITPEWNPSGYLHNSIHQVGVAVGIPAAAARPAAPLPETSREFRNSCLPCHEMDAIAGQRLTRAQWEREVDKMIRWGAPVRAEDRGPILEFLVRHFGPRPRLTPR
jgi:DMSO/TMAO reductase YedYZ molybdopterin-dependent catalytic subunit